MTENKTVLVVGGSGGIGSAIAGLMTSRGFRVCSTYHKKKPAGGVTSYQMDISDGISVEKAFRNVLGDFKRIDVVVFSVTTPIENKPVLDMEWDDIKKHLDVQTKGLLNVVRNLKEQIKAGHKIKFIVLLTEYCIGTPPAGLAHYITAKYSLLGFAKSMAVELARHGCTVNMVSPGMVNTGLISNLPPKLIEITAAKNPLKRIATPADVANVVLFLSSDDSDYLNGANIIVNGGGVMS